ncbi:MAG TPA: Rne/Rng family ribonuclease [Terracidiphilus sp.]|nr:Rne/Rng family ribonuclease [Terracidiphilus sp.]
MAKEICISSTPHETRLAILEDDQLAEIYYERENEYTLAGSIYNGRVTRVLPGMQSAFVDIGLERDAFLYVTDFLELEDQEETDELEKASISNPNVAPREVRHSGVNRNDVEREPRTSGEMSAAPAESESAAAQPEGDHDDGGEHGARRWRGRRRRRGGRAGAAGISPSTDAEKADVPEIAASEVSAEAAGSEDAPASVASRLDRSPARFVLPGEALSKYGGVPAESEKKSAFEAPARPAVTSKPSTLIDAPLAWDGSGLLPGESISRHRERPVEPEAVKELHAEPVAYESVSEQAGGTASRGVTHAFDPHAEGDTALEEEFMEESLAHEHLIPAENPEEEEFSETEESEQVEAAESSEGAEGDASASHHVDPLPPSSFRLFGFGKGKKDEESGQGPAESHPIEPFPQKESGHTAVASAFSPGNGLVEEEVIEGEETETPLHRHHKHDEHDLDEYEEETLQTQIRSGELGEMLQEAHLDHRIQMDFDDKAVAEEEEGGEAEEEDEPALVEGQPAPDGQQPRRDRDRRGRRGRGERGHRPGERRGPSRRSAQATDLPVISDLLKPGQEILVQIAKEPIAKKGARITSHIALPGRFLVFMPTVSHVGVSRKIASDEERQRLKRILVHERGEASGGFIVRTAAEGASEDELRADLRFLIHLWNEIKQRSDGSKSPALIYHDLSLIERILRDQVSANFSSIWVDSEADYERILRFLNRFSPSLVRRVKLYTKETPLFEHFGIQEEISKALRSKVWLKSGGSIVINQTEALVAIDINTGKYVGKTARLEDTIVKTNLDAIPEIVRQIRLRDLGGIIIIDFIDMDERRNRFKVMAALEEALKNDRAPTKVLQFNDFGLVAITRKRVKQSLERTLSVPCPICQATGMVKSPATVCNEIFIELRKMRRHFDSGDILLRVNPETVKVLKANNARWLTDFEELTGKNILVKSDPALHPEQFDIQG